MKLRAFLPVAALVSTMVLPGFALAQQEHMISGKTVPVDQVTEVQAKCDELHKAAADKSAPAAAPAEKATPANGAAAPAAGWTEDGSKIDLSKLTVAMCQEGNFMAPAM